MSEEKSTPVVEFNQVSKNYGYIKALDEISFEIFKGEIFGYIGPNGAGKTTTLKILVGLIQDYSGEVRLKDKLLNDHARNNNLIGYLPQNVGFQEWRTVDHALMTFGLISGMSKEKLNQRVPEVLQQVGLENSRHRKIQHLSGGMKQKLKLAQALLHHPPILILDEPMSGLDPTSRWQMKNIIKQLAQTQVTIIFSSHILEDVEGIATKIGIINQGQLVKIGSPQELQKELVGGAGIEVTGKNIIEQIGLVEELSFVDRIQTYGNNPDLVTIFFVPNTNIDTNIMGLLKCFVKNNLLIRTFNYLKPSLEKVYLKYILGDQNA